MDGQTQADAISQMKQAGFNNYKILQPNGTVPKGYVISTNPPNGQGVSSPTTTQVIINVSAGVGKVSVPSVVNQTQNAATTALTNAHLNYNIQQDPQSTKPQGTVTRQDPVGGTQGLAWPDRHHLRFPRRGHCALGGQPQLPQGHAATGERRPYRHVDPRKRPEQRAG